MLSELNTKILLNSKLDISKMKLATIENVGDDITDLEIAFRTRSIVAFWGEIISIKKYLRLRAQRPTYGIPYPSFLMKFISKRGEVRGASDN